VCAAQQQLRRDGLLARLVLKAVDVQIEYRSGSGASVRSRMTIPTSAAGG
jgi:hypothetical protein